MAAQYGSPIIPNLSRINPIPRIDTYFFKVHSILPSHLQFALIVLINYEDWKRLINKNILKTEIKYNYKKSASKKEKQQERGFEEKKHLETTENAKLGSWRDLDIISDAVGANVHTIKSSIKDII